MQSRLRGTGADEFLRYLRVGFHAPEHFVERPRVRAVWAILRARHPLLASKVIMRGYDEISFGYVFFIHILRGPLLTYISVTLAAVHEPNWQTQIRTWIIDQPQEMVIPVFL